jgi:DNA-binding NtrC family response regulator
MRSNSADGSPSGAGGSAPKAQTILLVDDEADILESLKGFIEASLPHVRVRTVLSGKEGLQALRDERIDLILTDYKMPGMNGLEFLAKAKDAAPGVPRVLITAFPDVEIAIKAINEANIENFFTKPFEPDSVVEAIRAILFDQRTKELTNQTLRTLTGRGAPAEKPAKK